MLPYFSCTRHGVSDGRTITLGWGTRPSCWPA